MGELILIRGLPGSGKSTMARTFERAGYLRLEADLYFEAEDGRYIFNADELPAAHDWCLSCAKVALESGQRVVVANTFTQRWEMAPYMEAASFYGAPCRIINATGRWQSVHKVPGYTLARMRERWENIPDTDVAPPLPIARPTRHIPRLRPVR